MFSKSVRSFLTWMIAVLLTELTVSCSHWMCCSAICHHPQHNWKLWKCLNKTISCKVAIFESSTPLPPRKQAAIKIHCNSLIDQFRCSSKESICFFSPASFPWCVFARKKVRNHTLIHTTAPTDFLHLYFTQLFSLFYSWIQTWDVWTPFCRVI